MGINIGVIESQSGTDISVYNIVHKNGGYNVVHLLVAIARYMSVFLALSLSQRWYVVMIERVIKQLQRRAAAGRSRHKRNGVIQY